MTAIRSSLANSYETTLTAEMGPNDLSADVAGLGSLVTPCWLVVEMDDDAQREYIWFDGVFGGSTFVTTNIANRYQQGSAAGSNLTHPIGSTVRSSAVAGQIEDLHDRVDAIDHGNIGGLTGDDHVQYSLVDGSRAFTAPVAGVTPVGATDLTTKDYVAAQTAAAVPPGVIMPYGGLVAPSGYLECNGSEVSRATFNALFLIIDELYGAGNGTTTFGLPDLRGRFPIGLAVSGTASTLGDTGGAIDHVHSGPSHIHTMPSHTHSVDPPSTLSGLGGGHFHNLLGNTSGEVPGDGTGPSPDASGSGHYHDIDGISTDIESSHQHNVDIGSFTSSSTDPGDTNAAGTGDTGTENPPFLAVQYIIKT